MRCAFFHLVSSAVIDCRNEKSARIRNWCWRGDYSCNYATQKQQQQRQGDGDYNVRYCQIANGIVDHHQRCLSATRLTDRHTCVITPLVRDHKGRALYYRCFLLAITCKQNKSKSLIMQIMCDHRHKHWSSLIFSLMKSRQLFLCPDFACSMQRFANCLL